MAREVVIQFKKKINTSADLLICLSGHEKSLGDQTAALVPTELFDRGAKATKFKGKSLSVMDFVAPEGMETERLALVGMGEVSCMDEPDWLTLGGKIGALLQKGAPKEANVLLDRPDNVKITAQEAILIATGLSLNAYSFDLYKTKNDNEEDDKEAIVVTLVLDEAKEAEKLWNVEKGVVDGTVLARNLVNEPANILGPVEFADHAKALEKLGVDVEILTEKELTKLKMGALLGVAQGSVRPPRLAVMKWMGGDKEEPPVALVGKGVVFDTGGISIKPSGGMEDMKGDMGGAAAVIGAMHAISARKAKANVIGILGLVENMPDGNAQRPGDIVTSMSGQTIEVINTDAEGRLVLCDALTYVQQEYSPKMIVNLATLTGAIIVALGHHHGGLFSNDDDLAVEIVAAGQATGENMWRMPMSKDYDKLIESKFADMKNVGTRAGGAITAAQFLGRFVGETPWAHLDIAGMAMGSLQTEINKSWGSGFGVRLLDRLIRDYYE